MKNKQLLISGIISFLYVGLGTISLLSAYPAFNVFGFNYDHSLWMAIFIITLPVHILSFGLMYAGVSMVIIFLLQTIIFLLIWAALYFIWNAFRKYKMIVTK